VNTAWGALAAAVVVGATVAAGWWFAQFRIGVGTPAAASEVELLLNDFRPDAVVVPVGTTVSWRFDGVTEHDIVGDGWGTPSRRTGVFTHTFAEAGIYDYRCTLHGPMRGRVVVEDPRVDKATGQ
jgi:plastocyanin